MGVIGCPCSCIQHAASREALCKPPYSSGAAQPSEVVKGLLATALLAVWAGRPYGPTASSLVQFRGLYCVARLCKQTPCPTCCSWCEKPIVGLMDSMPLMAVVNFDAGILTVQMLPPCLLKPSAGQTYRQYFCCMHACGQPNADFKRAAAAGMRTRPNSCRDGMGRIQMALPLSPHWRRLHASLLLVPPALVSFQGPKHRSSRRV